jgi:aminoglycoside 6-adenylyltransferase
VADRVDATGVLLVGGASERFGSPKALARFRGETLAERAWRTLEEVCAEVIVVGKAANGLELPFPVVDDGGSERAPVFGVMAGLRAATHDICLVLPVDCPLVTSDLLRELLAAKAVPQTGPLPGVFTKSMLPMLEERVAAGELSLRGVNPAVLELDALLLTNANTRMELLATAVADWASEREDVAALVVVGSQARDDVPADRWSDLDLILLLDSPSRYTDDATWTSEFGNPVVTFLEATMDGHWERRVLYETGEDVDFVLFPAAVAERIEAIELAAALLARGYRVLLDRIGVEERLARAAAAAPRPASPSQHELTELASDFWYHALWTAKKLRRGEVFTAIDCLNGYMKWRLVTLMAWHARALEPNVDTWHSGRFLERWGDPGALVALETAYARYSVRDVARALWESIDLFQGLEEETAQRLGLAVELDHPDLRRRIAEVVPDPRRASTLRL